MIYAISFCMLFLTEFLIALYVHDDFIRPYVGDVLVTVLLCCLCRVIIPTGVRFLPAYVLAFAAMVEVTQYFDLVKLIGLADIKFFATIMGRSFSWVDILCYAIGCAVFFGVDAALQKKFS